MRTAPIRKKVLVVDDDVDTSELIAHVLRVDYEVLLARDGIEGIEQAAKGHPDLVITDVDMPRLGGLAMVRLLRAEQGLCVPIIFVSGRGTAQDIIAGIGAGARHYLTKPVVLPDLRERVDLLLSRK
ncbi:MAG: response regulator [Myxococcales bacterium]|jgi:DNA-binding response OmpR family regulator